METSTPQFPEVATIKAKVWIELSAKHQQEYRGIHYTELIGGKTFYACKRFDAEGGYCIQVKGREVTILFDGCYDIVAPGVSIPDTTNDAADALAYSLQSFPKKKRERLDVMLDIESLSTAYNGATIQIAAVPFHIEDNSEPQAVFNRLISPKSCVEAGLDVNADTMKWWFSQDSEVQHTILAEAISKGDPLPGVLEALSDFLKRLEGRADKVFIWGYPATSDMTWLQQAYLAAKLPYPVAYNRTRCLGTIADLYWEATGLKLSEQVKTKINHDALVDCQSQIEMVTKAYAVLAKRKA